MWVNVGDGEVGEILSEDLEEFEEVENAAGIRVMEAAAIFAFKRENDGHRGICKEWDSDSHSLIHFLALEKAKVGIPNTCIHINH